MIESSPILANYFSSQPCRTRHLKCNTPSGNLRYRGATDLPIGDQATPKCGRCKASNRDCNKGYPYRVYKSISPILHPLSRADLSTDKFADDQKWLRTPNDRKSFGKFLAHTMLSSFEYVLVFAFLFSFLSFEYVNTLEYRTHQVVSSDFRRRDRRTFQQLRVWVRV
jgi:hypothetical protein